MEVTYFFYGVSAAFLTATTTLTIYNAIQLYKLIRRYNSDKQVFDTQFDNLYYHADAGFSGIESHINEVEDKVYREIERLKNDIDIKKTQKDLLTD